MHEIVTKLDNVKVVNKINHSQSEQSKKLTAKMIYWEKIINDRLKGEDNTNREKNGSLKGEKSEKSRIHFLFDKSVFDIFPKKIKFVDLLQDLKTITFQKSMREK